MLFNIYFLIVLECDIVKKMWFSHIFNKYTSIFFFHGYLKFKSYWRRTIRSNSGQGLLHRKRCKQTNQTNYAGRRLHARSGHSSSRSKAWESSLRKSWRGCKHKSERLRPLQSNRLRYDDDRLRHTRLRGAGSARPETVRQRSWHLVDRRHLLHSVIE